MRLSCEEESAHFYVGMKVSVCAACGTKVVENDIKACTCGQVIKKNTFKARWCKYHHQGSSMLVKSIKKHPSTHLEQVIGEAV